MTGMGGLDRTLIVNTGRMRSLDAAELAAFDAGDRELSAFLQAVKGRLDAAGMAERELRLTTGDGVRLTVGPAAIVGQDDPEPEVDLRADTAEELVAALDRELALRAEEDEAFGPEPTAGADSPLTAPTGERLLDEPSYAGMREAVLNISRALGAMDPELFDALVATCERSVSRGLEQAVAAGSIPLDRLESTRDALSLELELFKAAAIFRRRIATVQDRVRAHVATEEANAGAPPAIQVIRHNAPKNGGGT